MQTTTVEQRLRVFLLIVAGGICATTLIELWLTEHMETAVQFIPFVLCGVGLLAIAAALRWPQRGTLFWLRFVMVLLLLGSAFGVYEHLEGNIAFAQEIKPNAAISELFVSALRGANPLLAPGILALAAMLALAATYAHPALVRPLQAIQTSA